MKYFEYRENSQQGTLDFPIAHYHVDSSHPRYQMPYHWHPEYEIIRIHEGSFQMTINGRSVLLEPEDTLLIQGGTLHGGIPENCAYECLVYDMRLLLSNNKLCSKQISQLLRHELTINLKLPLHENPALRQAVNELFNAISEKKPGFEFLTQGYLYHMIGILFELQAYHIETRPSVNSLQIKRFKDVLSFIEEHYTEAISLEDMAGIAGLSPRYFCRFFRKMTQCTPTEYLNYYRIECACEQLAEIQISITEVALNCGFNDISYFIKSFHKAKGITPKRYREFNRKLSGF